MNSRLAALAALLVALPASSYAANGLLAIEPIVGVSYAGDVQTERVTFTSHQSLGVPDTIESTNETSPVDSWKTYAGLRVILPVTEKIDVRTVFGATWKDETVSYAGTDGLGGLRLSTENRTQTEWSGQISLRIWIGEPR